MAGDHGRFQFWLFCLSQRVLVEELGTGHREDDHMSESEIENVWKFFTREDSGWSDASDLCREHGFSLDEITDFATFRRNIQEAEPNLKKYTEVA